MPAGNNSTVTRPGSRLRELGVVLPTPPSPLGAYVEVSWVGSLLFLSGTSPLVNRKQAISGRLGTNLSVEQGQEAARLAALNVLAAAQEHVGDLDKLKKLVSLSVFVTTTKEFVDHAAVADGATNLFVQLFGAEAGLVRLVCDVYCAPIRAPVMVQTVFEIESSRILRRQNMSKTTNTKQIRLERRLPSYWRVTFDHPPLNRAGDVENRLGYHVAQLAS